MNHMIVGLIFLFASALPLQAQLSMKGFYRFPALHSDTVIFAAEGDLWSVPATGGVARRLTTHPADESDPAVSPDGKILAFTARYEGPAEVYTMPVEGGLPVRRTFESDSSIVNGWTPKGRLVYATTAYSTLPDQQLVTLDLQSSARERIPLSQASEAAFNSGNEALFFVRPAFHRNVTKRYKGGTARRLWKFVQGSPEAVCLTSDYTGESHSPMWWKDRVYFVTDRDGTMNLWSMNESGRDLKQHTRHSGWDVRDPDLNQGRIVYQVGADLWIYDIGSGREAMVPITLASDFDQLRERWVKQPMQYLTSVRLHPKGESLVLTARGRVFVAPAGQGRLVRASRKNGVRYRDAVFMPEGGKILTLGDESGELEFLLLPANGVGAPETLTGDGEILRFEGLPSPDGKWIAYTDNNSDLWLLNVGTKEQKVISLNREGVDDIAWAPDSRWLAFSQTASNTYQQIQLYNIEQGTTTPLTSDRVNSRSAAWSPNGEWIYFLSDRNLVSVVGSPWGPRQPEPFFDKPMKMYHVALRKGLRSPFRPADELVPAPAEKKTDREQAGGPIEIDLVGLQERTRVVPVPPGAYRSLSVNNRILFWIARDPGSGGGSHLMALEIGNKDATPSPSKVTEGVTSYELSGDGKKILVRKRSDFYVFAAATKAPSNLAESKVDLSAWTFPIDVREDWRQIFIDAWRLERDYFYDPGMHGVDWDAVLAKHLPLVDRITTRNELSDIIGWMVGELSALHTSVRGGDQRTGPDNIRVPTLGARLIRDPDAGGYRIDYIYRSDPDYPEERSPLADPDLEIDPGDIIRMVNGVDSLSVGHINELLRGQGRRQVLLSIWSGAGGPDRDVIVTPTTGEQGLRYSDWEYTRRLQTEEKGGGKIGYVHLRAMGSSDLTAWYRQFYPVFDRQGLIIDVRHNRGGNIESILLEKLMRRAWAYWRNREQDPYWNMQYAFRGHMIVLSDENTASDGEAFAYGFQKLGLGKVVGMRSWGGEIWLGSSNRLSDGGLARAPMMGLYGNDGEWIIEGHGVDPDIVVENMPHATFNGNDAQLDAAIEEMLEMIRKDPRTVPSPPAFPDKSFKYPK